MINFLFRKLEIEQLSIGNNSFLRRGFWERNVSLNAGQLLSLEDRRSIKKLSKGYLLQRITEQDLRGGFAMLLGKFCH